jgi:hypothetical protein
VNAHIQELLFKDALKYCRMRLLPWSELGYEDTVDYGLQRSELHNSMCKLIDVDRRLVEQAFTKAESKYGPRVEDGIVVDGSIKGDFDFAKAYDDFCKELVALSELPYKERHPDNLTDEDLDKMDFSDLVPMPTMESENSYIDESRIVREEWIDQNGNKNTRFKYGK